MHVTPSASSPPAASAVDSLAPPPPPASQRSLMLMGLLQGMALYALFEWVDDRSWLALGMLLAVQVPLFMGMAVTRWRTPALWAGGAVMALVVLLMGGWAVWRNGHSEVGSTAALLRMGVAVSLWWFVALAWFQAYLERGRWRIAYQRLFVHAWNNALVLLVAAVCVLLIWLVLWLCAALFALVGVKTFANLFIEPWFAWPFSGLVSGLGLWLARTLERSIQMARQVILALGHVVLPLMGWVVVMFVLSLVFTRLQTLWDTRFAAAMLMGVVIFQIWLLNAVYQDGSAARSPYPRWVQHVLQASLLAMLVLATLACVAVGLRVQQYGWTAERLWAAVGSALLWLYAAGYAAAALHSWRAGRAATAAPWLAWLSPVNRALSVVVLAVLLALQTPLLDPDRLSARSQLEQLSSGAQPITHERLMDLKFNHGPYGAQALQTLGQSPVAQREEIQTWVQEIAASPGRHDVPRVHDDKRQAVDVPAAQERIQHVAGPAPDADWWPWLLERAAQAHWASSCLYDSAECVLITGDWDGDGQADHLLCDLTETSYQRCRLSARGPAAGAQARGAWNDEGAVEWRYGASANAGSGLRDALRHGQLQPQKQRWPNWSASVAQEDGAAQPMTGRLRNR